METMEHMDTEQPVDAGKMFMDRDAIEKKLDQGKLSKQEYFVDQQGVVHKMRSNAQAKEDMDVSREPGEQGH